MALFMMVFLGTTPIGGPLIGWIAQRFGSREALLVGAVATTIAGAVALARLRHFRSESPPTQAAHESAREAELAEATTSS